MNVRNADEDEYAQMRSKGGRQIATEFVERAFFFFFFSKLAWLKGHTRRAAAVTVRVVRRSGRRGVCTGLAAGHDNHDNNNIAAYIRRDVSRIDSHLSTTTAAVSGVLLSRRHLLDRSLNTTTVRKTTLRRRRPYQQHSSQLSSSSLLFFCVRVVKHSAAVTRPTEYAYYSRYTHYTRARKCECAYASVCSTVYAYAAEITRRRRRRRWRQRRRRRRCNASPNTDRSYCTFDGNMYKNIVIILTLSSVVTILSLSLNCLRIPKNFIKQVRTCDTTYVASPYHDGSLSLSLTLSHSLSLPLVLSLSRCHFLSRTHTLHLFSLHAALARRLWGSRFRMMSSPTITRTSEPWSTTVTTSYEELMSSRKKKNVKRQISH